MGIGNVGCVHADAHFTLFAECIVEIPRLHSQAHCGPVQHMVSFFLSYRPFEASCQNVQTCYWLKLPLASFLRSWYILVAIPSFPSGHMSPIQGNKHLGASKRERERALHSCIHSFIPTLHACIDSTLPRTGRHHTS